MTAASAALVLTPASQPPIAAVHRAAMHAPALREPSSLTLASAVLDDFEDTHVAQCAAVLGPTPREASGLIFPSTLTADMLDDLAIDMGAQNAKAEATANLLRAKMAAQAEAEQRAFDARVEFEARQEQEAAAREAETAEKEAMRQEQLAARAAAQEEAEAAKAAERAERAARGGAASAERAASRSAATKSDRGDREKPECFYCL